MRFTKAEAAKRIGVTRQAIGAAITRGEIESKDGLIAAPELQRYAAKKTKRSIRTMGTVIICRWCGKPFDELREGCPTCSVSKKKS